MKPGFRLIMLQALLIVVGFSFHSMANAATATIKTKDRLCAELRQDCRSSVEGQFQCKSDAAGVASCIASCPSSSSKENKKCEKSCKKAASDAGKKCVDAKRTSFRLCETEYKQCRKEGQRK